MNFNKENEIGSHWVSLALDGAACYYYDAYGSLPPPFEILDYLGDSIDLYYNAKRYQDYGTTICGHLCLRFLYDFWRNIKVMRRKKKKKYIKTRASH